MAAAAYTVIGSRARRSASTTTYTFVCYGSCAVLLALACLLTGQRLGGYPAGQWALLLLITATAQLLGHSVFNHLVATTGPLAVGFLHTATGSWTVPIVVLLAVLVAELAVGWGAGRPAALPEASG